MQSRSLCARWNFGGRGAITDARDASNSHGGIVVHCTVLVTRGGSGDMLCASAPNSRSRGHDASSYVRSRPTRSQLQRPPSGEQFPARYVRIPTSAFRAATQTSCTARTGPTQLCAPQPRWAACRAFKCSICRWAVYWAGDYDRHTGSYTRARLVVWDTRVDVRRPPRRHDSTNTRRAESSATVCASSTNSRHSSASGAPRPAFHCRMRRSCSGQHHR